MAEIYPDIPTDWKGRAIVGHWWASYYFAWLDKFDREQMEPGGWCPDRDRNDWWVTETPEFDKAWFSMQGVRPPKKFGTRDKTEWVDYGEGLRRLHYNA